MALSASNICLRRNANNFRCIYKNLRDLKIIKTFQRNLRGSRYGKHITREESKYYDLLKSLKTKSNKPAVCTTSTTDVQTECSKIKEDSTYDGNIEEPEHTTISQKSIHELLQEKITPLKEVEYTRQLKSKYKKSLGVMKILGEELRNMNLPIALETNNLPCPVLKTLSSPLVLGYRNQDEFSVGEGLDGNSKSVGFYIKDDDQKTLCVSPENINIIKDSHKKFLQDFEFYINKSSLPACHWPSVKVRSNQAEELMGIITMDPKDLTQEELIVETEKLKQHFSTDKNSYIMKSLYLQTSVSGNSSKKSNQLELLLGDACISEYINGMKLQISPGSYFPCNTSAAESMHSYLKKLCRVKDSTTLLEIFCGAGSLSLFMSSHVQRCIGVDPCSSSIKDAKLNAAANNKYNVEFLNGDPDYLISDVLNKDFYEDLIAVINTSKIEPSGAIIQRLRSCKHMKKIIYITTIPNAAVGNFVKLCRPAKAHKYLGKYFVPILAAPVDLFPQTNHYGLVVMFQRL